MNLAKIIMISLWWGISSVLVAIIIVACWFIFFIPFGLFSVEKLDWRYNA